MSHTFVSSFIASWNIRNIVSWVEKMLYSFNNVAGKHVLKFRDAMQQKYIKRERETQDAKGVCTNQRLQQLAAPITALFYVVKGCLLQHVAPDFLGNQEYVISATCCLELKYWMGGLKGEHSVYWSLLLGASTHSSAKRFSECGNALSACWQRAIYNYKKLPFT